MRAILPVLVSLAVLGSGCSANAATPAASADCLPVSSERAALILGPTSGMKVIKAEAVKSTDHSKAYYVAIRFSGAGVDNEVGIWATNGLESGSAFSVDGFAEQFSGLPKMDGFSVTDTGAKAAKACV